MKYHGFASMSQLFMNHMFLAIKHWQMSHPDKMPSEQQITRLMRKYDYPTLKGMVDKVEAI